MKLKAGDSINGVTLQGYICTVDGQAFGPFKTADAAWRYVGVCSRRSLHEKIIVQVLRDPFSEEQDR